MKMNVKRNMKAKGGVTHLLYAICRDFVNLHINGDCGIHRSDEMRMHGYELYSGNIPFAAYRKGKFRLLKRPLTRPMVRHIAAMKRAVSEQDPHMLVLCDSVSEVTHW